jgi:hypothetical protein
MLIEISGTIDGEPWPARGETADLPDPIANDLIINRYAIAAGKDDTIETAAVDPVEETATTKTTKARKASN